MKRLLLAAIAAGALFGASEPARAAPPTPFNWSGFYLGGHVGGSWSADWQGATNEFPSAAGSGAQNSSFSPKGSGVIAGGQIGYNWQFAPAWVIGVEADLSWIRIHTTSVNPVLTLGGTPFVGQTDCPGAQICTTFMTRNLDSLGTVRARLGYAWDRWLAYLTGGFAYGRIGYAANFNVCCQFAASFAQTKPGWSLGGGLEYALPGAWSAWTIRGEYLFVSLAHASTIAPETSPPNPAFAVGYNWNRTNIQIARFALSYRFGQP